MYPGPLATNLCDGHYYGLPLDTNTRVMMYNADTLAAAGLDAPPATFDDLRGRRRQAHGQRHLRSSPTTARRAGTCCRGSGAAAVT